MNTKKLFYTIVVLLMLASCGKDDGSEKMESKNNEPEINDQSTLISEDIDESEVILIVKADDDDGDDLTFSIIEDIDQLFELTLDGELSLRQGKNLDYESSTEHILKISVSDGDLSAQATLTVSVKNVIETLAEDPTSFVMKWDIPAENYTIAIGTNENYQYDFTIDWGDGTVEQLTSQNPSHEYELPGIYYVAIQGQFPSIRMGSLDLDTESTRSMVENLVGLEQWGTNEWESFNSAFLQCVNMLYSAIDRPNLQNVEDMSLMFAVKLYGGIIEVETPSIFNADLSDWDVSNITDFSAMFLRAEAFNSDLSGWDVSNALNFSSMFHGATLFNADISGWDVSNVTDMSGMFLSAISFDQDISSWDVSNVTSMTSMFSGAHSFNAPIGGWQVNKVTDMSYMFNSAFLFNQDIGDWDVSNVIDMSRMFAGAENFNQDIGNWDVGNATDMSVMFADTNLFNQDIGNWNVSNVTNMSLMFAGASAFNMDITGWDLSNVEDTYAMFAGAENFNQDISSWDVSNVKSFFVMFVDAISFNQNLGGWNLNENISTMGAMFDRSGMSPENYGATLVGWHNNINPPQNVELGAEGIEYCEDDNAVVTARSGLITDFGWTINGDSSVICN
jgi:surface protein